MELIILNGFYFFLIIFMFYIILQNRWGTFNLVFVIWISYHYRRITWGIVIFAIKFFSCVIKRFQIVSIRLMINWRKWRIGMNWFKNYFGWCFINYFYPIIPHQNFAKYFETWLLIWFYLFLENGTLNSELSKKF